MEDRRTSKRTALNSRVIIKRLDDMSRTEVNIEVTNLSKTGVGFLADRPLEIGEIYESYLTIWDEDVLHTFLLIVRIELVGGSYSYGAEFIGISPSDIARIERHQTADEEGESKI